MSDIKDWSNTANNNNSTPPDGFPEGMNPSDVNNAAREVMAAVRRQHEDSAWIDLGDTPSYVSATSFTISGDVTTAYAAGRRIRATDSSTLYGVISSSSYGAPNTTVNVTLDSGSLSGSLSAVALSVLDNNSKGGTIAGDLTVSGTITGTLATAAQPNITSVGTLASFTSTGIDDNASKKVIQVDDTSLQLGDGTSAEIYDIHLRAVQDGYVIVAGGNAQNDGGNIVMYGSTHSSNAGDVFLRSDATSFLTWDESTGIMDIDSGSGASKNLRLRIRDSNTNVEVVGEFGVSDSIGNRRLRLNADNINATVNYANNGPLILQTNSLDALTLDLNQNTAAAGKITAGGDTAAGDNATMGYTATEGLILTGQGSVNDVTIKNDADAAVMSVPTGTQNATFANDVTVTGDISAANLSPLTLGTEQATTSGTEVDFTSIPSGTQKITIMLDQVSLDATSSFRVLLGDSGGFETSGYYSTVINDSGSDATLTAAFLITQNMGLTTSAVTGSIVLTKMNSSHKWLLTGTLIERSVSSDIWISTGSKTLTAELDRVRVAASSGNFDAGNVNILYQ